MRNMPEDNFAAGRGGEFCSSSLGPPGNSGAVSNLADLAASLKKPRISIDQCFLSTIVNGDSKSQKLSAALDAAHARGKIICPIHLEETIFESSFLASEALMSNQMKWLE